MRRLVVGTAGHVDHGKTALVTALTGVDGDRLREEQLRGITIELSFGRLELGDGLSLGLVDVPGHERFVRTMVAGAGGVDLALLVVACDEGVMPQTREHLDVLSLLGVRHGVLALTKADLLPELGADWTALLHADLDALLEGGPLASAPRLLVSARTGEGLPALREALAALARAVPERSADGPALLPIDRAFSVRGFGTVVTGTLLSGRLAAEAEVSLAPGAAPDVRLRGLQVHGAEVAVALAGQRVAVNLAGVEPAAIGRGRVLVSAGRVPPSRILDVELTLLPAADAPLRHLQRLELQLGTASVSARVALFDRDELAPGETSGAQLRLGEELVALPGQRFVARGPRRLAGRGRTIAGGRVLAIAAGKRRGRRPETSAALEALRAGDAPTALRELLVGAGVRGLTEEQLQVRSGVALKLVARTLEPLAARGEALLVDRQERRWLAGAPFSALAARAATLVRAHHLEHPLARGVGREELRTRLQLPDARLLPRLVQELTARHGLVVEGELLRDAAHEPGRADKDAALLGTIRAALQAGSLSPPDVPELARRLGEPTGRLTQVLRLLEQEGAAVRITPELWYDVAALAEIRARLVRFLQERGEISTQEFKELVGTSRKYSIPLGEHFDREHLTLRVGETRRVLRGGGA